MAGANEQTLKSLAESNREYLVKFGYIFIVCATGKSAEEMLSILKVELTNESETEIRLTAMNEVEDRHSSGLRKLATHERAGIPATTHVLDTSVGRPAAGVNIPLFGKADE